MKFNEIEVNIASLDDHELNVITLDGVEVFHAEHVIVENGQVVDPDFINAVNLSASNTWFVSETPYSRGIGILMAALKNVGNYTKATVEISTRSYIPTNTASVSTDINGLATSSANGGEDKTTSGTFEIDIRDGYEFKMHSSTFSSHVFCYSYAYITKIVLHK